MLHFWEYLSSCELYYYSLDTEYRLIHVTTLRNAEESTQNIRTPKYVNSPFGLVSDTGRDGREFHLTWEFDKQSCKNCI